MKRRYTILLTAALAILAGCSKPDRSEEANNLKNELQDQLFSNPEQVLTRVDSAEHAGVFTETTANLIRSNVYGQMGKTRLAVFYGEQVKHSSQLRSEGINYYSALLQLTSLLDKNGEWGKAIHLADEIIADVDEGGMDEQLALRIKSRAYSTKASCEEHIGLLKEAERHYLESIDLMMGVTEPKDYWIIDALVIAVIETTEFYLKQEHPEKALALAAKSDTALAGTNRTYVYDALRECAHKTPVDFINGYRLRYAAGLLATTKDSVSLIAELCGLSRRTFYRLFEDAYSMSPSDYRKVAKN